MASVRKRGKKWVAEVYKAGVRKSKSFDTKGQASAWAAQFEAEVSATKRGDAPDKTFGDLLSRYADEVSVKKRGERWERIRITAFLTEPIANVRLSDLRSADFTEWRDARLKKVSASTVSREMALLSHACLIAVKEWNWLRESPMTHVSRPKSPPPRDRLISTDEIERILLAAGYDYDKAPESKTARVAAVFLFAIETAMRAGEIIDLEWNDIDLEKRVARLTRTKNGTNRNVPLSTEATRILNQLPRESALAFNLNSASLDALFRKLKDRVLIEDLHFHDTRHEAITRLAKKLPVLDLARMTGHKDLRMLMIYYNEPAEEIAKRLD